MEIYIVTGILVLLGVIEVLTGVYANSKNRKDDWIINILSIAQFAILIKPGIVFLTAIVLDWLVPQYKDSLANLAFWKGFIGFMLIDDFIQYWYHRKGHEWNWLWKFHKTHHTTPSMNIGVAFRQNVFWFIFMPNLYIGGLAIYLGLGQALVFVYIIKGTMELLIHVGFRFDLVLHNRKSLRPFVWVLERVLALPDTHHMHHGLGEKGDDHVNYSSFLFMWDVIFGTAKFPHTKQDEFGTKDDPKLPWYKQLYSPFIK
jgi:sterol desaturase/sphingolipid hydroxylase (fatty acid hydroxylase superfamily)